MGFTVNNEGNPENAAKKNRDDRIDVVNLNEKGLLYESAGMFNEALRCYETAVQNDTKNPPRTSANQNRARLLGRLGRWEEALSCEIEEVRILDRARDVEKMGEWIKAGGIEEAMKKIEKLLEADGQNFPALYVMGHIKYDLEKIDESIQYYCAAIRIDPKNELVQNDLGLAYARSGRYDEALRCICAAIELDPEDADFWNNKGNILRELGNNKNALECYNMALNIDPDHSNALHNKGDLLFDAGKIEEALKCYRKELEAGEKDERENN